MGGALSDGQVLGWGALAVTDPDTGAVFEDEPDPDTGTVFEDEPLMDIHHQTDLQSELAGWLQQASASLHSREGYTCPAPGPPGWAWMTVTG